MRQGDTQTDSRWRDNYHSIRPNMAIFNLVDAENSMAREIADAVRVRDCDRARAIAEEDSPLKRINSLFRASNFSVAMTIQKGDEIRAHRGDGPSYGMAEMSDGERNAVLVAADVLTASPGSLFLIDEPERHLHRSIITPFLASLLAKRHDCFFVVATHELGLAIDFPDSQALLLRQCHFHSGQARAWNADLLEAGHSLDENLQRDVLGARRRMLFVEGKTSVSLDQPLYGLLFPDCTILPKKGQNEVIHSVKGLRNTEDVAWVKAFGIVDRDNKSTEAVAALRRRGIFALDWYSVESIYYHPRLQKRIAERRSELLGGEPSKAIEAAKTAAMDRVRQSVDHIVDKKVSEAARREALSSVPMAIDMTSVLTIPPVDVPALREEERRILEEMISDGDLTAVIERYPARETGALQAIATEMGFRSRRDYEAAVLKLLDDDNETRAWVTSLFEPLISAINGLTEDESTLVLTGAEE